MASLALLGVGSGFGDGPVVLRGELSDGDAVWEGDRRCDRYRTGVSADETLIAVLESDAFSCELVLRDLQGEVLARSEPCDGDARLAYPATQARGLELIVTSVTQGRGPYLLIVERSPLRPLEPTRWEGRLEEGDGSLEGGGRFDWLGCTGLPGEPARFELHAPGFAADLLVCDGDLRVLAVGEPVEGAPGDLVVGVRIPADGEVRLAVLGFAAQGGAYRVTAAPRPAGTLPLAAPPVLRRGRLDKGDSVVASRFVDAFPFEVRAGERWCFQVVAPGFDAAVVLAPTGSMGWFADDGLGTANPLVLHTMERDGTALLTVTSYHPDRHGDYELRVIRLPPPRPWSLPEPRRLVVGETLRRTLEEGNAGSAPMALEFLTVRAGQRLRFEVTSEGFDLYLGLIEPTQELIEDDALGRGARHRRFEWRAPAEGVTALIVSSTDGSTGSYRVRVERID